MSAKLATEMSPPFSSVAVFFSLGLFFYLASLLYLLFYFDDFFGHHISQNLAGLAHLFFVGYVAGVMFGAMYQLLPVALEIPMFSKDFAYIHAPLHFVGTALLVYGFFYDIGFLSYGALILCIGVLIYLANAFLTIARIKEWDFRARYLLQSSIFLFLGALLGMAVAVDFMSGFLGEWHTRLISAHILFMVIGFMGLGVVGISAILVPMFMVSHRFDDRWLNRICYPFGALTLACGVGLLFDVATLYGVGFFGLFTLFGLYLYQLFIIYKKRTKRKSDFWSEHLLVSFLGAIFSLVFALLGYFDGTFWVLFALGVLFLVLAPLINGHIYKIVPFLVWFHRFSPLVGKQKVPMLHEMVKQKLARIENLASMVGAFALICGVALKVEPLFALGALLLFVGGVMVWVNYVYAIRFKG